jgi:hypothetical protein
MRDTSLFPSLIRTLGVFAICGAVGVLAACGAGSPAAEPVSTPSETTTTATPAEIAATAQRWLVDGPVADVQMTLRMTMLGVTATSTGQGRLDGPDGTLSMNMATSGGGRVRMSYAVVDGTTLQRVLPGPWVTVTNPASPTTSPLAMATLNAGTPLKVVKRVQWHGQDAVLLRRVITGKALLQAMGGTMRAGDISGRLTQTVLADAAGFPRVITGQARLMASGQLLTLQVKLVLTPTPDAEPLATPAGAWRQVSALNGLVVGLAPGWTREREKDCTGCTRLLSSASPNVLVVTFPTADSPENGIHYVMSMVQERGGSHAEHHPVRIGGTEWQMVSLRDRSKYGSSALTAGAAVVAGHTVMVLSWDEATIPAAARRTFVQVASTVAAAST